MRVCRVVMVTTATLCLKNIASMRRGDMDCYAHPLITTDFVLSARTKIFSSRASGHLHITIVPYQHRNSHDKIGWSRNCLIFKTGILTAWKTVLKWNVALLPEYLTYSLSSVCPWSSQSMRLETSDDPQYLPGISAWFRLSHWCLQQNL